MRDLIDRERLLNSRVYSTRSEKPNYEKMLKNLVNDILTAPTVDAERHAHWIQTDSYGNFWKCSNCGKSNVGKTNYGPGKTNFCSNCGCEMDEVEE